MRVSYQGYNALSGATRVLTVLRTNIVTTGNATTLNCC